MEKQINQIVKRREKLHLNDPRITECWNELIAVLSESEELTIAYLLSCEEQKLFWLSEVFDDLSVRFKSLNFIECLEQLREKFPELELEIDIEYSKK